MKMIFWIVVYFPLVTLPGLASEEKSNGKSIEIKAGGAVTAFSKEDGFKLTDKAKENIGVKFKAVKGSGPWIVPKSSLVKIKLSTGVYRKWDGWITMVLVSVISQTDKTVTIKSVDLQDQDLVAVSGAQFLRMTESDLNSDTVDACSH